MIMVKANHNTHGSEINIMKAIGVNTTNITDCAQSLPG